MQTTDFCVSISITKESGDFLSMRSQQKAFYSCSSQIVSSTEEGSDFAIEKYSSIVFQADPLPLPLVLQTISNALKGEQTLLARHRAKPNIAIKSMFLVSRDCL